MTKRMFFVAGTDTGVGKTCVTMGLLQAANDLGLKTLGLKPVAAGCEQVEGHWRNEDAQQLMQTASLELPYEQVNPVALPLAMAPHIAAMRTNKRLDIDRLVGLCRGALSVPYDVAFIEGAGGWMVPINDRHTLAELPKRLGSPVILVVGMRLGCLNHALLTVQAIRQSGVPLAGWVANCIEPEMAELDENIRTLHRWLNIPCLGVVPWLADFSAATVAKHLDVSMLLDCQ